LIGQTNEKIRSNKLQRTLRKEMTDAEQVLWRVLRGRQLSGLKFRRQHPFGDYILDFVCLENLLVIEVDGGQHEEQAEYDEVRTHQLHKAGFHVLRFWNNEVLKEIEAVKEKIWMVVRGLQPHPHPGPPLEGEGENLRKSDLEGEREILETPSFPKGDLEFR
jgi:adenine-specific DNA-methyltransferase